MITPPGTVSGYPRAALPFGLFSVLALRPAGDRWEAGVQWESITCESLGALPGPDCHPKSGPGGQEAPVGTPLVGSADPFTVYGIFAASPTAYTPQDAEQWALQHLYAREEAKVEELLWDGEQGNTPVLASDDTTVITAGSDAAESLGLMEDALATEYGSLGVIHMSRGTATALFASQLLTTRGAGLFTQLGTPVVAGSGYPGTGPPDAQDADKTGWIYGSPALFGYRSEPFFTSSVPGDLLTRGTNDLVAVVERTYVLGFDPCGVHAVLAVS